MGARRLAGVGEETAAEQAGEPQAGRARSAERQPTIRRPRYLPFLVSGAVAGLVLALVLVLTLGGQTESARRLFFYLGILLAGLGALAGGALAVWLERDDRP